MTVVLFVPKSPRDNYGMVQQNVIRKSNRHLIVAIDSEEVVKVPFTDLKIRKGEYLSIATATSTDKYTGAVKITKELSVVPTNQVIFQETNINVVKEVDGEDVKEKIFVACAVAAATDIK